MLAGGERGDPLDRGAQGLAVERAAQHFLGAGAHRAHQGLGVELVGGQEEHDVGVLEPVLGGRLQRFVAAPGELEQQDRGLHLMGERHAGAQVGALASDLHAGQRLEGRAQLGALDVVAVDQNH